jgi:heptosyltransferase-2
VVRAVRRAFPHAYLAYLCNRRTEEILRRNEHLNELFIYERDEVVVLWKRRKLSAVAAVTSLLGGIRRRRFDLAIDLSLGERYSFLLGLLGVPRRIGFDFRRRGRFLTHRLVMDGYRDRHVVEHYVQLLRHIGMMMRDLHLELPVSEADRRTAQERLSRLGLKPGQPAVGLIPAGGVSWGLHAHFRRWPQEGFVEVGSSLSARYGAKVLIFGEAADQEVCTKIAEAIGPAAVNLVGKTSLGEFVDFIRSCDVVVSNDGGPVHIAASQDVPTVSIFGPVDPGVYGPYPLSAKHRVVFREDLPCRPCYHRFKLPPCPYERACLRELSAEDVLSACEAALAGAGAS